MKVGDLLIPYFFIININREGGIKRLLDSGRILVGFFGCCCGWRGGLGKGVYLFFLILCLEDRFLDSWIGRGKKDFQLLCLEWLLFCIFWVVVRFFQRLCCLGKANFLLFLILNRFFLACFFRTRILKIPELFQEIIIIINIAVVGMDF